MNNILIVEDRESVAESLAALLRPLAHRIAISPTLRDARDRLLKNGFTIVLLDLTLPDSPRHETIDLITEIKREHQHRKVIVISGAPGTKQELDACAQAGADAYLEKFDPSFQERVCELAGTA